ncbi:major facilitator superfamily domain-containing protein [Sphaerosporella brunnea]|uniref:Major facilitator superfamily domain-containing protein n=1 Tax=Sphaerosporella brunnea TaxID=1250544 RepID=A0A5J5F4V7_9PEZI|nr:major facilitator superfamily domain-containing protein [Sphaerosporella brunnea]
MTEPKDEAAQVAQLSMDPPSSNSSTVVEVRDTEGIDTEWRPSRRLYIIFLSMCVITLAAALDATSISVALPIIAEKLHGTAIEAFWAGTSFLLCSTVLQPTFASFSSIFGRKSMIMVALVFFTVGSIVAAAANNFTVILVGRSIQGIGGGGMIALTEIIVTDIVPLRKRGQYFGFLSSMWALGSVSGPILGGGFSENVTWRWIMYINLPFCGIGLILIPLFLNLNQRVESVWVKLGRVDWLGAVLFVASTTAILIPISWGGVMYPWDHWRTLVPLILGFFGMGTFVAWEVYGAREPLITLRVFMNRTAAVSYFGTVMHGIILWSVLYYLPLYFEAVKNMSPIMAGVSVFPETFTVAPASIVVGIVVSITGRFRWAVWTGWTLTTTGMGLMYLLDVQTKTVAWIFLNLVGGLGTGMLFPSMAFAIQASASNEDTATAVAMFSFLRAFGQSFGVAIGGVIFQNELLKQLGKYPGLKDVAGEYAKDAVALVQIIKAMPHTDPTRAALVQAYADAVKMIWLAMVAFGAAGLVMSFGTKGLSLDRVLVSEQGLREKKKQDGEKA